MSKVVFARDPDALCKGADHVLVIGPRPLVAAGKVASALPFAPTLALLARDLDAGELGAGATTLLPEGAARLSLAVLPEPTSRHDSPARAEALRRLVQGSGVGKSRKGAVLLLLEDPGHLVAAANAVARTLPLLDLRSGRRKPRTISLLALGADGAPLRITGRARHVFDNTREACRLVDMPPTELDPERMAKEARALLRGLEGVTVRELRGKALVDAGLGGIHGVGRAARSEPRMLVASWNPARKRARHVALVGKGVTYDTGGLNLKIGGSMPGMKCDMGGAAAVLGAFRALVQGGCKQRLSLVLCLAENAIGPLSVKPDDVLTMHSGKTVEINNTDAEGRLLLADGVSWAARKLGADLVVDAATLTGAQLVSTGLLHAGLVCNGAEVEAAMVRAGLASGDLVHPLPFLPAFHKLEFKSAVADMRNSVKNRMNAQSSCAAQFVHWHLEGTGVDWAHVDLAGPAYIEDRGTGFGVALLEEFVQAL
ncbi:MAG: leucyl aminopeptidase family protein [Planctomycetota bacterium]